MIQIIITFLNRCLLDASEHVNPYQGIKYKVQDQEETRILGFRDW